MRLACIVLICLGGVLILGGCAQMTGVLDTLVGQGTDADGNPTGDATGGPLGMVASMLGFGNVVQGAIGLYSRGRRRQYLKAGMVLSRGVDKALAHIDGNGGTINKETLLSLLKDEQQKGDVHTLIKEEFRQPVKLANGVPKLGITS